MPGRPWTRLVFDLGTYPRQDQGSVKVTAKWGWTAIPKTIAPAEKFDLYLGVDEGVVVKRDLLEEKSDDTLIGNIPSSTKKISY